MLALLVQDPYFGNLWLSPAPSFYYFFFDLGRQILVSGIYFLNFFLNPPNNQASSISDAVIMELADQLWFSFR